MLVTFLVGARLRRNDFWKRYLSWQDFKDIDLATLFVPPGIQRIFLATFFVVPGLPRNTFGDVLCCYRTTTRRSSLWERQARRLTSCSAMWTTSGLLAIQKFGKASRGFPPASLSYSGEPPPRDFGVCQVAHCIRRRMLQGFCPA